jgi:ribulose-5-phosphate 4-epimerase/fuculose-1-phosphate aldolase
MATKVKLANVKADFITALRIISHEGLSDAFAHLSARVEDGKNMLFMPRKSPALVTSKELFVVNFDKLVPQSAVHQAVYRARENAGAVIHFHSPAVILLSVVGQTIQPMHNYSAIFYEGRSRSKEPARWSPRSAQGDRPTQAPPKRLSCAAMGGGAGQLDPRACICPLLSKSRRAYKSRR